MLLTAAIGIAVLAIWCLPFIVLFIIALALIYAAFHEPAAPQCDGCGDPMPNGYECYEAGKRYCRRCTTARGSKPWYYRPELEKQ